MGKSQVLQLFSKFNNELIIPERQIPNQEEQLIRADADLDDFMASHF